MRSRPPAVAAWLLGHLQSGCCSEHIIGDLTEAYQSGRSRVWYWKQVLAAIFFSFCQEIMAHPVLALRALATGWATWYLIRYGAVRSLVPLTRRLLQTSGFPFSPFGLAWTAISLVLLAGNGWIVARLHRPHRTGMVLLFAASVLVLDLSRGLPWIWFEGTNTLTNTRFLPYLLAALDPLILQPLAILLGGLWGASAERESRQQRSAA
jgi:hypothetical protein